MRILTLNTHDSMGGAARASYNSHKGLKKIGVESKMLVAIKRTAEQDIIGPDTKLKKFISIIAPHLDGLPKKYFSTNNENLHSPSWFSSIKKQQIDEMKPDLIHLHWVQGGFVSIDLISRLDKPIVWTLHDMWPFSGAEHYSNGSERYIEGYFRNNKHESETGFDLNKWVWNRKKKYFDKMKNITLVAPSRWMTNCAKKSALFRNHHVETIPVGLDHKLYCPRDKKSVREILCMPQNKKIILIGAMNFNEDKRKGGHLLEKTFANLSIRDFPEDLELYVLGASEPKIKKDFGIKTSYFGTNRDDLSLALLYSAVDLFIAPSLEENFAATVFESLSCGIPVAAFNIGGMPDMISHKCNGYLAEPFDINDLLNGIKWILYESNYKSLSKNAREYIIRECTLEIQAKRYKLIYERMLK